MYSRLFYKLSNYMINYPIKWYTFVNRLLPRFTTYDNIIIINKNVLENNLICLKEIEELFKNCKMIKENQENKDFILWYFNNKNQINFIDKWLEILIIHILNELKIQFNYSSFLNNQFFIQTYFIRIYVRDEKVVVKNMINNNVKIIDYSYQYFSIKEQFVSILIAFFNFV